jgi:hypothetical protein
MEDAATLSEIWKILAKNCWMETSVGRRGRLRFSGILLKAFFTLAPLAVSTCFLLPISPKLDASIYFSESTSGTGTFGLGIKVANNGFGRATDIEYNLTITGSLNLPIAYTVSYSYSEIISSIAGLASAYTSIIGSGDVYIPCGYECDIVWYDDAGKKYDPISVKGSFNVDNLLSLMSSSQAAAFKMKTLTAQP